MGPGKAWPLASIVRGMTSLDATGEEVWEQLGAVLGSTGGLGLVHEGMNTWDGGDWSRHWFSWANGMFGQLVLEVERKWPFLLDMSFQ